MDRLGGGSILGILGFLVDSPRHSTVLCDSYVQAYHIDEATFLYLIQKDPSICERLWQVAGVVAAMHYVDEYKTKTPTMIRHIFSQSRLLKPPPNERMILKENALLLKGCCLQRDGREVNIPPFTLLEAHSQAVRFGPGTVLLLVRKGENIKIILCSLS